jgi:hypothetical protein
MLRETLKSGQRKSENECSGGRVARFFIGASDPISYRKGSAETPELRKDSRARVLASRQPPLQIGEVVENICEEICDMHCRFILPALHFLI